MKKSTLLSVQSRCAQLEHSLKLRELCPAGQQKLHPGQTHYTHFFPAVYLGVFAKAADIILVIYVITDVAV